MIALQNIQNDYGRSRHFCKPHRTPITAMAGVRREMRDGDIIGRWVHPFQPLYTPA
jgi:hypothetical protein